MLRHYLQLLKYKNNLRVLIDERIKKTWCVSVCVCVYVYICVCVCVYIYVYIYTYKYNGILFSHKKE